MMNPVPVKDFPQVHYPALPQVDETPRCVFNAWGATGAVDVSLQDQELKFLPQNQRRSVKWEKIQAQSVSLPVLKHNSYPTHQGEPCMSCRKECRKKLIALSRCMRMRRGKVQGHSAAVKSDIYRKIKALEAMGTSSVEDPMTTNTPSESTSNSLNYSSDRRHDDDDLGVDLEEWDFFSEDSDSDAGVEKDYTVLDQCLDHFYELTLINVKQLHQMKLGVFEEDCEMLKINPNYTGGCLSVTPTPCTGAEDCGIVATHRGKSLSDLFVAPYTVSDNKFVLDERKSMVIPMESRLYQVSSKLVQGQVFVGARQDNRYKILRSAPRELYFDVVHDQLWEGSKEATELVSMEISPYIPGEALVCAVSEHKASAFLMSQDGSSHRSLGPVSPRFSSTREYWRCYYGAHPRQITMADISGVSLWDVNCQRGSDLLTLPHQCLRSTERVVVAQIHPTEPFYHIVATDFNLLLLDARFPSHTVLTWPHSLLSHPQYLDVLPDVFAGGGDVFLLGGQTYPEVHVYPVDMETSSHRPPVCSGSPWRASKMIDFAHLACQQDTVVSGSKVDAHLAVPLVGMCGIPHRSGKHGFSILQSSSVGNLFCQDYVETECLEDKTKSCAPGSARVTLPEYQEASDWLKNLTNDENLNNPMNKPEEINLNEAVKEYSENHVDGLVQCCLCESRLAAHVKSTNELAGTLDKDFGDSDEMQGFCYHCSLPLSFTSKLSDNTKERKFSVMKDDINTLGDEIKSLDLDPTQYDTTTQIMLRLWEGSDISPCVEARNKQTEAVLAKKFADWKEKKVKEGVSDPDGSPDVVSDEEYDGHKCPQADPDKDPDTQNKPVPVSESLQDDAHNDTESQKRPAAKPHQLEGVPSLVPMSPVCQGPESDDGRVDGSPHESTDDNSVEHFGDSEGCNLGDSHSGEQQLTMKTLLTNNDIQSTQEFVEGVAQLQGSGDIGVEQSLCDHDVENTTQSPNVKNTQPLTERDVLSNEHLRDIDVPQSHNSHSTDTNLPVGMISPPHGENNIDIEPVTPSSSRKRKRRLSASSQDSVFSTSSIGFLATPKRLKNIATDVSRYPSSPSLFAKPGKLDKSSTRIVSTSRERKKGRKKFTMGF